MAAVSIRAFCAALALLACLPGVSCAVAQEHQPSAQSESLQSALPHGVLIRVALHPPMRGGKARLEFSPDGKYLLLQSESGLFLFETQPLKPVLHIDADYLYPVHFTRDSKTLSGVSLTLQTARWRVPNGETVSTGELQVIDGCVSGAVSPDGERFVCRDVGLDVRVFDLSTQRETFRGELRQRFPQSVTVPLALPRNNVDPAALGLVSVRSFQIFANEGRYPDSFSFSPDEKVFGVSGPHEPSLWNVSTKRKMNMPAALTKYPGAGYCFLDSARVLLTAAPNHPEIVSLATGKVVGQLGVEVSTATLAANQRYLIFKASEAAPAGLYDLEKSRKLDVPDNVALDLRADVLAILSPEGQLHLFHFGEQVPFASTKVPTEASPTNFSAAASPNLDLLAFGFGSESGLYKVETGRRILTLGRSSQMSIPNSEFAYLATSAGNRSRVEVLEVAAASALVSSVWKADSTLLRGTPSAFIEYEVQGPKQHVPEVMPDGKIPFQLTARDSATGDVLWEKKFITVHPVPFVDPQGKNLVLAWEADSEGGREAAKRCPQAWRLFQKSKPTHQDTFFEIVDSMTGDTVGGLLVRTGSGPLSFDAVAAEGSTLLVAKGEGRVTLYSLDDGEIKARLNGSFSAASLQTRLLALAENETNLGIYDLRSGKRLTTQSFGQPITYAHFSDDGNRLLVLTRQQIVYVLDVSHVTAVADK